MTKSKLDCQSQEEFSIPDNIQPTALLILGYQKNGFLDANLHSTMRKALNDTVMIEGYSEYIPTV